MFVADSPVSLKDFNSVIEASSQEIEDALHSLGSRYSASGPIQIVRLAGGFQLSTKPAYADVVAQFLKPQKQKLSRSMLEVLAIVVYQQPITSAEIEAVRGVQSDYGLNALQERRLIREVGRKQTPGRPMLYGTTQHFLHQFNLNSLDDLPTLQLEQGVLPGFEPNKPELELVTNESD